MIRDLPLVQLYARLTRRQQEVVQLLAEGYSNREIAVALCIETSVVAGHLTNIYGELHNVVAEDPNRPTNRYAAIRWFTLLFEHYPELRPD